MIQLQLLTKEEQSIPAHNYWLDMLREKSIYEVSKAFDPIYLAEMDSVALLNRIDTKFVFSTTQLIEILHELRYDYRILTINNQRIHHYRTVYYDTPGFDLYTRAVTERADVFKVRSRVYLDTHEAFLEIKHKNAKKRTDKCRIAIPENSRQLSDCAFDFMQSVLPFSGKSLEPKLGNMFKRITLVNKQSNERVTIDIDLSFSNGRKDLNLEDITVAEVKQDQYSVRSAFMQEMRNLGIRASGFSKYCFGVSQLHSHVKWNSQKERLLMIEKIQHKGFDYVYVS
jgi:hypothetical protein